MTWIVYYHGNITHKEFKSGELETTKQVYDLIQYIGRINNLTFDKVVQIQNA